MKLNPIRAKWVLPIIQEAADLFLVTSEEVLSDTRVASVCSARHFAVALARHRFKWSYPELGIVFGLDHTTCINAVRVVKKRFSLELERALAAAPRGPEPVKPPVSSAGFELFERYA